MSDVPSDTSGVPPGRRRPTDLAAFLLPLGQVHSLNGNGYHTGEQYRTALNTHVGVENWSLRVLEHGYEAMGDEFWALVELTVILWLPQDDGDDDILIPRTVVKQAFGGQDVKRRKSDGMALSTADARKGAVTDGLKKAATELGFGLYLSAKNPAGDLPYRRGEDDPDLRATAPRVTSQPAGRTGPSGPPGNGTGAPRPRSVAAPAPALAEDLEMYEVVRAEAVTAGYSQPWINDDPAAWSGPQLAGYRKLLDQFLARQERIGTTGSPHQYIREGAPA